VNSDQLPILPLSTRTSQRRLRDSPSLSHFLKSFEGSRTAHFSEDNSENDDRPPISNALRGSIRDFLELQDPIAIETRGTAFSAFGDLDEGTHYSVILSNIESSEV
jgi:hypothetical protein